jgi:DNA polymerase-3 subunit delta'
MSARPKGSSPLSLDDREDKGTSNVWGDFASSRVVEGLRHQLAQGAPAHAWLLLGPRGSGKRAVATAIAAALNCPVTPGIGCGTCLSCTRTLRGRHPDVHNISPEGLIIAVDVIREAVIPEAARSTFEARYKVFVIEEADRMNDAAQNALLKTLEEPQHDTVFVLISDNEEELLETLRSRCRIVHLEPVSEEQIVELLEQGGAAREHALVAARASEGDLQRARALVFDEAAGARRALWASLPARLSSPLAALDAAAEVLDQARQAARARERAQRAEVSELAEAMGEGRGTGAARNALAKRHRRELKRIEEEVLGEALFYVASFYRDAVALRAGGRAAVTNLDAVDFLEWWARSALSDRSLLAASERCLAARASFEFNANPTLAVESALVELTLLISPPVGTPA